MRARRKSMSFGEATGRLMMVLSQHLGPENAIGMDVLYEQVFGEKPVHKINRTKDIRKLITALRDRGIAIGSRTTTNGGGYYQVRAGSELDEYCLRMLHKPALRKLRREAALRKISMPELIGQISFNISRKDAKAQS